MILFTFVKVFIKVYKYIRSTKIEIKGLKEVRSKISMLLETTGGILFSLEGFQKCLLQLKLYAG